MKSFRITHILLVGLVALSANALRAQLSLSGNLGGTFSGVGATAGSWNSSYLLWNQNSPTPLVGTTDKTGVHLNTSGTTSLGLLQSTTTSLTFQNKGPNTNGNGGFPDYTGVFHLTFTPVGGTTTNIADFTFHLDFNAGGSSKDQFTSTLSSSATGSFTSGSFLYRYSVIGTPFNQSIAEGTSFGAFTQNVGFKITSIEPIPESSTFALFGSAALVAVISRRHLRKKRLLSTKIS
jgi:hypothetical protein